MSLSRYRPNPAAGTGWPPSRGRRVSYRPPPPTLPPPPCHIYFKVDSHGGEKLGHLDKVLKAPFQGGELGQQEGLDIVQITYGTSPEFKEQTHGLPKLRPCCGQTLRVLH